MLMMQAVVGLMLCCAVVRCDLLNCSSGLSSIVLHENAAEKSFSCLANSFKSTSSYVSDTVITIQNVSYSSKVAVIPSSFSTVSTSSNHFNFITVFDFFGAEIQNQWAELLSNGILAFTQHYNWTNIAVFSDALDHFYLQTGTMFYKSISNHFNVDFLQVGDELNEINPLLQVEQKNQKIVILSMTSQKVKNVLTLRSNRLKWPEYVWIVHSIDKKKLNATIMEGIVEVQARLSCPRVSNLKNKYYNKLCNKSTSTLEAKSADIFLWENEKSVHLFNYSRLNGLITVTGRSEFPTDDLPQYVPHVFIALYYLGILICLTLVTGTLMLIYFTKKSLQ